MKSKIAVALICPLFSFLVQNAFATSTEVSSRTDNIVDDVSLDSPPSPCTYYPDGDEVIVICKPPQR